MDPTLEPRLQAVFRRVLLSRACPPGAMGSPTLQDMEGWDSLAHIDLIAAVEEEFRIAVNIQDIQRLKTFDDFASLVRGRLSPGPP